VETDLSPTTISSKDTPNVIRGLMNLCHNKIFSSLLHATHPEINLSKRGVIFVN
jgi:hypothetical protein